MKLTLHLCALPLLLILASCAAPSPPVLPAVVPQRQNPAPPQVTAPAPQGDYWKKACEYRRNLQQELSVKLTPLEPCLRLGLDAKP